MTLLYGARNFSTLIGLGHRDPLSDLYEASFFRATWVLTALDAGFWTAMSIKSKWLRDIASMVFSVFYLVAAETADEKVRKVRGNVTVEHLRVSWNKGTTPYLRFFQSLVGKRHTKWPPRQIRIPRPPLSDYKEPVDAWLYFDGSLEELRKSKIQNIILDIPGGGFVAMDPRCNDDRLLAWATQTRLPILSLDYKKAPEYPYPHALNEAFDVYTALIESSGGVIGLSATARPRIVITGDSAGGNLATAMTILVAETQIDPRPRGRLPMPDGLILFYPALDMNIGNWMSDEQMSLINDRGMRHENKSVLERKRQQYSTVACNNLSTMTDDEPSSPDTPAANGEEEVEGVEKLDTEDDGSKSPRAEFAHRIPFRLQSLPKPLPFDQQAAGAMTPGGSYKAQPLRTRLASSSMISYFNDRILTPEMMRSMILLYIGPHNRPNIATDYHLSPILAPDELLARFPKTYFLTGERDPLVDDTVIFCGRLRRVKAALRASGGRRLAHRKEDLESFDGRTVAEVDLLPGVSHGFMQFPSIWRPAWKWIARAACWAEDAFADAERRDKARAKAERRHAEREEREGGGGGERVGRHHNRSDSSGSEGVMLEIGMGMTKMRRGSSGRRRRTNGTGSTSSIHEDDAEDEGDGSDDTIRRRSSGEMERLKSSDDLLGRRMNGLTGGLTGLTKDDS
jgi:acetyl esterase/lipase